MKPKRFILRLLVSVALCMAGVLAWWMFFRPPNAREINAALTDTVIPKFYVRDASLSKAVEVIAGHVRARHPEFKRVDLATHFEKDDSQSWPITMDLHDIPASEALRYVASLDNRGLAVRDGAIYIYPITGTDYAEPPPFTMKERLAKRADDLYWQWGLWRFFRR